MRTQATPSDIIYNTPSPGSEKGPSIDVGNHPILIDSSLTKDLGSLRGSRSSPLVTIGVEEHLCGPH
jgi:hypothetical protein